MEEHEGRDPAVITWEGLRRTGREHAATLAGELTRRTAAVSPDEVATIASLIDDTNRGLPSYARIKKFALLPTLLTEAAGEITPSMKIRRAVVAGKYRELLESLYR